LELEPDARYDIFRTKETTACIHRASKAVISIVFVHTIRYDTIY